MPTPPAPKLLSPWLPWLLLSSLVLTSLAEGLGGASDPAIEQSPGAQHPNFQLEGFVLRSVYMHKIQEGKVTLHRKMKQFDENPHLRPRDQRRAILDLSTYDRKTVLTLAKLCLAAYPGAKNTDVSPDVADGYFYPEAALEPVYKGGEGKFGGSRAEELDAMQALHATVWEEIRNITNSSAVGYYPDPQALDNVGLSALEFTKDGVSVLVFRGTYSPGEAFNLLNWIFDWVLEKMSEQMKEMWLNQAQQPWDSTLDSRSKIDTFKFDMALRIMYWMVPSSIPQDLATFSRNINGLPYTLTEQDVRDYGMWPITKMVVNQVFKESQESGNQLLFSGHSQGGTRAQLASMYLRKLVPDYNSTFDAVTFSATGAQCFPRLLSSGKNLLEDVDPYIAHPQIRDYTHPLDPWGEALGREPGVNCLYGTRNLTTSPAFKYCRRIWGHPGTKLFFVAVTPEAWLLPDEKNLKQDFRVCRYFTHLMEAVLVDLQAPGALGADGIPDGGCRNTEVAPESDPKNSCPKGGGKDEFYAIFSALLAVCLIILCCPCIAIYFCCCRKKKKDNKVHPYSDKA